MYQSRRENNHKVSLKYKQLKNAEIERNMDTPPKKSTPILYPIPSGQH